MGDTPSNQRALRDRLMSAAKVLLGGRCARCGAGEPLQFDHVDPATKLFDVSQGTTGQTRAAFWAEVEKCQLLCLPCHHAKTKAEKALPTCHAGHPWTPENTKVRANGTKFCRECDRLRAIEYRASRRVLVK